MARAHSVWIVEGCGGPRAAFTVKHELRKWLRARESIPASFTIYRLPDGGGEVKDVINPMELL